MKKPMHNFTRADIGSACVYNDAFGASYSGRLVAVTPTKLIVAWRTSPTAEQSAHLQNYECRRVTLFPPGVLFMAVEGGVK